MRRFARLATAVTAAALSTAFLAPASLSAPAPHSAAAQRAAVADASSGKGVELTRAGTHETGVFGESAAEIPAFDAVSGRLFVVNAQRGAVDIMRLGADAAPWPSGPSPPRACAPRTDPSRTRAPR